MVRWSLRATICSRDSAGGRCLAASGTAPTGRCSYWKPDNVCRAICTSTSTNWCVSASGAKNLIRSPFYKSPPMEVRPGGKKGHGLFWPKRVTNEEFTKLLRSGLRNNSTIRSPLPTLWCPRLLAPATIPAEGTIYPERHAQLRLQRSYHDSHVGRYPTYLPWLAHLFPERRAGAQISTRTLQLATVGAYHG